MAADEKVLDYGVGGPDDVEGTPLERLTSGVSGAVILIALVLVCYISTLQFDYIWDDDAYVTQNATLRTFGGLSRIWTEIGATPQYYPMTFTTFWLEHQVGQGLNPRISHGINFLLHAGSALILWQLLRRLSVPGAWAAAALFAVHPIQVESVAWITERKNTLSVILGLAATFFYLRYSGIIEKPKPAEEPVKPKPVKDGEEAEDEAGEAVQLSLPDDPRRLYALFIIFFAMALFSKTAVAVLPLVLLIITWWKRGRITGKDIIPLIAPFVLAIGLGAVTSYIEHSPDYVGAVGPEWDIGIVQRIMLVGLTTGFYVLKLVVPYPLIFNYPKWNVSPSNVLQWLPLLGVIAVTVGSLVSIRKLGRGLAAGVLIFLVCLLPVMGLVNFLPMRFAWVADHFAYMASIAFVTLVSAGVAIALRRLGSQTAVEAVGGVLAGLAIVGCAALTIQHSFTFTNSRELWEATLTRNKDSWLGAINYGGLLIEKGKRDYRYGLNTAEPERGKIERDKNFAAAEVWLNRALKLNPLAYEAEDQLSRLALDRGQLDLALKHSLQAEQFAAQAQKKSFLQPQFLQANLFVAQNKVDEAIAKFKELQKYEELYANRAPVSFAQMRMALAETLKRKLSGQVSRDMEQDDKEITFEIIEQYSKAVELAPSFIPPKLRLAQLLIRIEEYDAALEQLRDTLAINRDDLSAKMLGAEVALRLDQNEVAGAQLINILQTKGDFLPAYVKLAEVYNKVGRKEEAIAQLDQALKLRKGYPPAQKLKDELEGRATTQPSTQSTTQPADVPDPIGE